MVHAIGFDIFFVCLIWKQPKKQSSPNKTTLKYIHIYVDLKIFKSRQIFKQSLEFYCIIALIFKARWKVGEIV